MDPKVLREQIERDIADGKIPFCLRELFEILEKRSKYGFKENQNWKSENQNLINSKRPSTKVKSIREKKRQRSKLFLKKALHFDNRVDVQLLSGSPESVLRDRSGVRNVGPC